MPKSKGRENGTPVVLVAEDDRGMERTLVEILGRNGFEVVVAGSGEEAVELSRRNRPDVILMDVMMPLLDGYAAARVLKRDRSTMHIPIIAFHAPPRGEGNEGSARTLRPRDEKHLLERILEALDKRQVGYRVRA